MHSVAMNAASTHAQVLDLLADIVRIPSVNPAYGTISPKRRSWIS
jgi:hypothetical protein